MRVLRVVRGGDGRVEQLVGGSLGEAGRTRTRRRASASSGRCTCAEGDGGGGSGPRGTGPRAREGVSRVLARAEASRGALASVAHRRTKRSPSRWPAAHVGSLCYGSPPISTTTHAWFGRAAHGSAPATNPVAFDQPATSRARAVAEPGRARERDEQRGVARADRAARGRARPRARSRRARPRRIRRRRSRVRRDPNEEHAQRARARARRPARRRARARARARRAPRRARRPSASVRAAARAASASAPAARTAYPARRGARPSAASSASARRPRPPRPRGPRRPRELRGGRRRGGGRARAPRDLGRVGDRLQQVRDARGVGGVDRGDPLDDRRIVVAQQRRRRRSHRHPSWKEVSFLNTLIETAPNPARAGGP